MPRLSQASACLFSCLLTASLLPAPATADLPDPLQLDSGAIHGTSSTLNDLHVYRGIPFAAPPTGHDRWTDPQPVPQWAGVRDATRFGARCVQGGFAPGAEQPLTSEDCLYLNVYSPADDLTDNLPVMVWIYGGGFFGGAGSDARYEASRLAEKGAVVVTFNYRLGVFGFFAHPELSAESPRGSSGNYALMDQIAALQWVQRNIRQFGGDPDNVTLFGESAGAQSVSALIASPLTTDLFQRAIVQSAGWMGWMGTGMYTLPTLAEKENEGVNAMQVFGARSLAELRATSTYDLATGMSYSAQVSVDGHILPRDPAQIFASGEQQKVDLLAGSNANESVFFGPGPATADVFRDSIETGYGPLADDFFRLYPAGGDDEANASYHRSFNHQVAWHMRQMARMQESLGKNAYVYFFTHVPPGGEARGATHVTELAYVYNQHDSNPAWTSTDRSLGDTMASYWVNFARSGNPNASGLPSWPVYTSHEAGKVQVLGDEVHTESVLNPPKESIELFERAFRWHVDALRQ